MNLKTTKLVGRKILAAAVLLGVMSSGVQADSLSVSPTRITVAPGAKTSSLTVKAGGKDSAVLQVRVMGWNEKHDPKKLRATKDVVISPPVAKLKPNQELTVRIVRKSKRPVKGRECYRILVDRLPGAAKSKQMIKLRVRHSIPMCFTS